MSLTQAIEKSAILSRLLTKKGYFASIRIVRPGKLRASFKTEKVEKVLVGIVRCGLDYSAQARVEKLRSQGDLPSEPHPLPWGQWLKFPYVIENKGKLYIRIYPIFSKQGKIKIRSFWFLNGKRVEKEEIAHMLLSSEFNDDVPPSCFSVSLENVKSLV